MPENSFIDNPNSVSTGEHFPQQIASVLTFDVNLMIENMLFCSKKGKKKNNLTWRVCFLICLKRTSLTQQRTELKVKPLDREEGHTANRSLPSCRSPQAQKKAVHVGQPCAAASPQNPWAVTFGSCCGGGGSPSGSPQLCEEHPKRAGGLWGAF